MFVDLHRSDVTAAQHILVCSFRSERCPVSPYNGHTSPPEKVLSVQLRQITDNIAEPESDGLKFPESFYNQAEWLGLSAFSAIEDDTKTSETSLMSVLKSQFW